MSHRAALVALCLAATLPTASTAHANSTHHVQVSNNQYEPKTLEIEPGDTVTWTAIHPGHTVTADDKRFDFHPNRTLNTGEQVSFTFHDEELIRYHCRQHPGMEGLIRVGDPPPPPPPPPLPTLIVPDDVPTITEAAAGAQPGTEVLVRPGVYPERVVVTVPRLTIRGLGDEPGEVVLEGEHRRDVGVTVAAPGVRIEHLSVARYAGTGIRIDGASGTVIADVVLDDNDLYGVDVRAAAGVTMTTVTATRHAVAGIELRDCPACGARIDDAALEGNAAGLAAIDTTGLVLRGSKIHDNAVGVVLRQVSGAQVTGNTISDNAATDVRVASVFDAPEPPSGAGVWVIGGRSNRIASNTLTGHTYNVAVTGPLPALEHRIANNTVGDALHADLGWDGIGADVCFTGNQDTDGGEPSSDPPHAQTLYHCALPATTGLPYPLVTANLANHALGRGG